MLGQHCRLLSGLVCQFYTLHVHSWTSGCKSKFLPPIWRRESPTAIVAGHRLPGWMDWAPTQTGFSIARMTFWTWSHLLAWPRGHASLHRCLTGLLFCCGKWSDSVALRNYPDSATPIFSPVRCSSRNCATSCGSGVRLHCPCS